MPRPSHPAKPSPTAKYGGYLHGGTRETLSYSAIDASLLHDALVTVTDQGDAVTFGLTSDGGAYYVGILSGGSLEKFYLDSSDNASECLRGVAGFRAP